MILKGKTGGLREKPVSVVVCRPFILYRHTKTIMTAQILILTNKSLKKWYFFPTAEELCGNKNYSSAFINFCPVLWVKDYYSYCYT